MIREKKRNIPFAVSLIVSILLLGALAFTLLSALGGESGENRSERLQYVLEQAAVQCYALEGEYPPDVQYLEDNYGVIIDHERFFVRYDILASNIRPVIMVFEN